VPDRNDPQKKNQGFCFVTVASMQEGNELVAALDGKRL
jgi:hypothetical protein